MDLASHRAGEAVLGFRSAWDRWRRRTWMETASWRFCGGPGRPGAGPEPATSLFLLKNSGGRLTVMRRFEALGRISSACFPAFRGRLPYLALAGEWGPWCCSEHRKDGSSPQDPPDGMGHLPCR